MFCVIIFLDSFFARIQLAINMQGAWHTWFKHMVKIFRSQPFFSATICSGAPNENIIQNHINIALLNAF